MKHQYYTMVLDDNDVPIEDIQIRLEYARQHNLNISEGVTLSQGYFPKELIVKAKDVSDIEKVRHVLEWEFGLEK